MKGRISLNAANDISDNKHFAQQNVAWATSLASDFEIGLLFLCCERSANKRKNDEPISGKQQVAKQ